MTKGNPFLKKADGDKPMTRKDMKKGGLGGRGLDALIRVPVKRETAVPPPAPSNGTQAAPEKVVIEVAPLDLERSPWQARSDFDESLLHELAGSIKANGIVQPPIVRRRADGKYELITGERRTRAAIIAGLKKIPVVLVDADDRQAAEMGVVENIQRTDLNVIEEAEGYRLLRDQFGCTQEEIAERTSKSRPVVANALRLLELPDEVKSLLSRNIITAGHAKVLLTLEGDNERTLLARECVERGYSVRELEKRVARIKMPPPDVKKGEPDLPAYHVQKLNDALRKYLGCAVRLTSGVSHANGKHTKGMIEIDFTDNDELDRILEILGVKID